MAETFNTLEAAKRRWPQYHIAGTGRWAVLLCYHIRLCEIPLEAMVARSTSCGVGCCVSDHRVEELKPEPVSTFRRNNSLHRMMAED